MSDSSFRKTEVLSISLPPEMASKVKRLARKEGRSISELFRECYRAYREKQLNEARERGPVTPFHAWANAQGWTEEQAMAEVQKAIEERRTSKRKVAASSRIRLAQ